MINLRKQKKTGKEIAKIFNVNDSSIYAILSGQRKSTNHFINDFNSSEYNRQIKTPIRG